MSINTIIFTGLVGKVFPTTQSQSGYTLFSFSVGVSSDRKNPDTNKYDTAWYNVKTWAKNDNYLKFLTDRVKPGTPVAVQGTLEFDPTTGGPSLYTGNDGNVRARFVVRADNVNPLALSRQNTNGTGNAAAPAQAAQQTYQAQSRPVQNQPQQNRPAQNQQQQNRPAQNQQQQNRQVQSSNQTPEMYRVDDDQFDAMDGAFW